MRKLISEIEDLDAFIENTRKRYGEYYKPQIETVSPEYNAEFLTHCEKFSEETRVDGLRSVSRYAIPNKKLGDVIHQAHTGIGCGIQIIQNPVFRLSDYEKWPGGYIQGFIRMDSDEGSGVQWFVWQHIRMEHLEDILEPFKNRLEIFE